MILVFFTSILSSLFYISLTFVDSLSFSLLGVRAIFDIAEDFRVYLEAEGVSGLAFLIFLPGGRVDGELLETASLWASQRIPTWEKAYMRTCEILLIYFRREVQILRENPCLAVLRGR